MMQTLGVLEILLLLGVLGFVLDAILAPIPGDPGWSETDSSIDPFDEGGWGDSL